MLVALHILREIIQTEKNGVFPNKNYFTIQVYEKLRKHGMDYIKTKKFIDDIPVQTYVGSFVGEGERIKTLEGHSVWDFRIRSFVVQGFRMFSFRKDERYYGLSLEKDKLVCNNPCSLYLVGANGSGKTSLYSSMEYCCTECVSAAKARGIKEEHYNDYIAHAKSKKEPILKVFFKKSKEESDDKEKVDKRNEVDKIIVLRSLKNVLSAFFCSEHEINEFCGKPQDLTAFFYNQIGYGNIVKIKEHLEEELAKVIEILENKTDESKLHYQILCNIKKSLLAGIQTDILEFMILGNSINKEQRYVNILNYLKFLDGQQIDWNDEWDVRSKQNALERIIPKLMTEKNEIGEHLGDKSTLFILYNDFITVLENIYHISLNKPKGFVPRRFQENELEFQLGKVEIKEFYANRKFILEWYNRIFGQFIIKGEEKGTIVTIKEISEELAQVGLNMDNVEESEETVRIRYGAHHEHLKSLIDGIEKELNYIREQILSTTESLRDEILSNFLMPSEEIKFSLSKEGKLFSTIYFKKDEMENEIPFEPREYLNSFRYKFYCILLKIVAAFTVKKCFNLNFPLIFDDIFYSSDFSNRDKVGDFIASIYEIHNKIFKGVNSPLQIIFYTHDDLILDAAIQGTSDIENVIYGRLFSYDAVEKEDVKKVDDVEFYNLYIPF